MQRLFHIDTSPTIASSQLLAALDRQGIVGTLTANARASDDGSAPVVLRVERAIADLATRIHRALDDAIATCELPLLTQRVGDNRFVVRPPAG